MVYWYYNYCHHLFSLFDHVFALADSTNECACCYKSLFTYLQNYRMYLKKFTSVFFDATVFIALATLEVNPWFTLPVNVFPQ